MDLHTWLDKPENAGKAVWLAAQIKRSKTAVSLWREQGVPLPLMKQIAEVIGAEVTVTDMLKHALECKSRAPEVPSGHPLIDVSAPTTVGQEG